MNKFFKDRFDNRKDLIYFVNTISFTFVYLLAFWWALAIVLCTIFISREVPNLQTLIYCLDMFIAPLALNLPIFLGFNLLFFILPELVFKSLNKLFIRLRNLFGDFVISYFRFIGKVSYVPLVVIPAMMYLSYTSAFSDEVKDYCSSTMLYFTFILVLLLPFLFTKKYLAKNQKGNCDELVQKKYKKYQK